MQKKAARLCCAILLMAVAIAASMGLMSAVFAAQSLRTPDTQAAEAPTEAPTTAPTEPEPTTESSESGD